MPAPLFNEYLMHFCGQRKTPRQAQAVLDLILRRGHFIPSRCPLFDDPTGGPLAAPTNLVVSKSTTVANALNLSWVDNATAETGYKVERSTDGVNFSALAGGGANMTFYRNTNLTPGRRYYYRVFAVNAAGVKSPYSNVASFVL